MQLVALLLNVAGDSVSTARRDALVMQTLLTYAASILVHGVHPLNVKPKAANFPSLLPSLPPSLPITPSASGTLDCGSATTAFVVFHALSLP